MKKWIYLTAAIATEVTATLSMKAALDNPLFYAVVGVGYITAFICLAAALKSGMALGVGYGIWGASGVALTAILSMIIFKEPVTVLMTIGIILVIIGVLTIELGSQAAHKKQGIKV